MSKGEKVLVLDSDSAVYACGFMAQQKTYFATYKEEIVHTTTSKKDGNIWAKEQTSYPIEELEWDFTESVEPLESCLEGVEGWIANQFEFSGCHRYILLLTKGGEDFRTKLATIKRYKGNRLGTAKPVHYGAIREYMQEHHKAKVYSKWEADDAACMVLAKGESSDNQYILAAIDKDLEQMSGLHFNPNKQEEGVYFVTEEDGWYSFYLQMLTGDSADNIKGLSGTRASPGIGKKKAIKILEDCETVEEMCKAVWYSYRHRYPEPFDLTPWWWEDIEEDEEVLKLRESRPDKTITADAMYMFRENADLLYMLRSPVDQYVPHITIADWKPYPKGVVAHILGD